MPVDEDAGQSGGHGRSKLDSNDPRAQRTRRKLIDAFHASIAESSPAAMSVAALTRAAGVNRTSFYSHFSSPEDLAIHALSELFDVVSAADIIRRAEHAVPAEEASRQALRDIVGFVSERRESYARVLGPGAAPRLVRAVTDAFAERTAASLQRIENCPPGADIRVTARFLAGGVLGVIGAWLSDEPPGCSPDELVEALVRCLPDWLNTDDPPPGRHGQGRRKERRKEEEKEGKRKWQDV
jgi:AcrR family transcriptional regulator